jgi:hypothetical protein
MRLLFILLLLLLYYLTTYFNILSLLSQFQSYLTSPLCPNKEKPSRLPVVASSKPKTLYAINETLNPF